MLQKPRIRIRSHKKSWAEEKDGDDIRGGFTIKFLTLLTISILLFFCLLKIVEIVIIHIPRER